MHIEEIKLKNFRNYKELSFHPDPGVNLLFGKNGSGKTNILEAIHYCSLGKSHRVSNDAHVVMNGEDSATSSIKIQSRLGNRDISIQFHPNSPKKKDIYIDHKAIRKYSDLMGCFCCVIFSPEDLSLIKDGPSFRRRYLDMMISQISTRYFIALQKYKYSIEQRNAIIRQIRQDSFSDYSLLDAFDEVLSDSAEIIIQERKRITKRLSELVQNTYRQISLSSELFNVSYHTSFREDEHINNEYLKLLKQNRNDDIRIGFTTFGPHRDDLFLELDHNQMKQFASQGQMRTAALSLKLCQINILKEFTSEKPVLLLDDVMSELDMLRRNQIIDEISAYQTFITCADKNDVDSEKVQQTWQVFNHLSNTSVLKIS